jgi:hypothetical protein
VSAVDVDVRFVARSIVVRSGAKRGRIRFIILSAVFTAERELLTRSRELNAMRASNSQVK